MNISNFLFQIFFMRSPFSACCSSWGSQKKKGSVVIILLFSLNFFFHLRNQFLTFLQRFIHPSGLEFRRSLRWNSYLHRGLWIYFPPFPFSPFPRFSSLLQRLAVTVAATRFFLGLRSCVLVLLFLFGKWRSVDINCVSFLFCSNSCLIFYLRMLFR